MDTGRREGRVGLMKGVGGLGVHIGEMISHCMGTAFLVSASGGGVGDWGASAGRMWLRSGADHG